MNDVRLVDGNHTVHQLREDLEVFLSGNFGPPLLDIFLKGLSRAIFCLDHQVQGYVWLLLLQKVVNGIDRSVSEGMCDRDRFIFEAFKKHQVAVSMLRLLFLLVIAIFRFI